MVQNTPTLDGQILSSADPMPSRISIIALGMSLGLLLAVSFVACVLFDLALPDYAMNRAWAPLFPGFTWLSWSSFVIGLIESFAYGWFFAVIFAPLYNFFSERFR